MDAPLQPAHLTPDGQRRGVKLEQSAFAAPTRERATPVARVTAVLAAESAGPVRDAVVFPPDVGQVHLHLRVDGLAQPRPVIFAWTFGEERVEIPGVLAPTDALTPVSSNPIHPDQLGWWKVEVFEEAASPEEGEALAQKLLFAREFQVL
ncbi:MAG: hypothetical protein KC636_28850 [Myxococcales bacterium]|nr:hypothetical protein [Myxococcales bacterium]